MKKKLDYFGFLRPKSNWHKFLLTMKISAILLFCCLANIFAAPSYSQTTKLTLSLKDATIDEVLNKIEDQSEFYFLFNQKLIDVTRKVDVEADKQPLADILKNIFDDEVKFIVYDRQIILVPNDLPVPLAPMQQLRITGKVTDKNGLAMPGVNVIVAGTAQGTITNIDGNYSIEIPKGSKSLMFTFVGMQPQEIAIGASTQINVTMVESAIGLDEVVVTALGIKREVKALGFAAQKIGENDLSASRETSITNYMTAKIAGVQVSKTASGTGGSSNVVIRGNKSFTGSNQPLYVVDGMPIYNNSNNDPTNAVASAGIDYGDGIGSINPDDVESINVLKGPAATALYGSRGSNGVVILTTKSGKNAHKGIGVEISSGVTFEKLYLVPNYQNKFGSGYGDEGYADQGWGTDINGVYYLWPDNGQLDSWGAPLDGKTMIPNWWTMPSPLTSSQIWDCPINNVIPLVAQPKDNVRNFFNTGVTFSNNFAVTSANEKSSMRLSAGSIQTSGIVPNEKISNKSVSFNGTTKVNEILSFDTKVNYIRTEGNQRPLTGYSESNPMYNLISMPRSTPLDFVKQQYEITKTNIRYPGINYNPYYMVNEIKNHDVKDRVIGSASTTLKFTSWLSLMGRVGIDFFSQTKENTWPQDPSSKNQASRLGELTQEFSRMYDFNADVMLTANKQVSENISLNGVLGSSVRRFRVEGLSVDGRGFKAKNVYDISNFTDVRQDSYLSEKEMQSVFFTGQLAYKNYLFFDVTGRNDWSSALGVKNQSFFYPSVSTGFVFTDAFDIKSPVLSYGKVRASWAQSGNDSDPYMTREGYIFSTTGWNGLSFASKSGTLPLFDLKNELTESLEFGADLRFLQNRINLDVTYYKGKTTNQILRLGVSTASGYNSQVMNAGEVQNSGLELTFGITPVKSNNFKWDINFNYAANHSKVVTLDGKIQTYPLISSSNGEPGLSNIEARVGEAFGNIVGYAYKRAPDGQKIVDGSGSYVRETKLSTLGNITPKWIGGLNNTFTYKGFSLNVLLDFKEGGQIVSATKYEMTRKGTGAWTVEGRRPKSRYEAGDVIPAGSNVGDPMPYTGVLNGVVEIKDAGGNVTGYEKNTKAVPGMIYWGNRAWNGIGEEFIEDGSYISLREVMLSYNFNPAILKKTPITGLTLSVFGRNLYYLQNGMGYLGLSPESAPNTASGASGMECLTIPSTRSYGFNIKLIF
jgi:TonB-linked SusC/RagA family outer membrane protein